MVSTGSGVKKAQPTAVEQIKYCTILRRILNALFENKTGFSRKDILVDLDRFGESRQLIDIDDYS
jgi:hypothetical protein